MTIDTDMIAAVSGRICDTRSLSQPGNRQGTPLTLAIAGVRATTGPGFALGVFANEPRETTDRLQG
jgi:hypothetical protein